MAQDVEIKIKAAVEGAQAAETLGSLRRALTELQTLAEETEIGSDQFKTLQTEIAQTTNRLAETSDRLEDVGDKIRTLSGSPVERLNASFGLLKDSIFNLDIDKAKIAVDGLVNSFTPLGPDGKVLTGFKAMGPVLSNLGSGVMSLGQTFLNLGRTLLMNPIFLLAATITAIGVGIVALLNKLGLLTPMLNAIGAAVSFVSDMFDNLTQAIGLSTAASDKHLQKVSELGQEERRQIKETYDARVSTATALEGLDSRQIRQIEKVTGWYLQQDKTLTAIQIEKANKLKDQVDSEIKAYEEIQKKNGQLNEEQKKKLRELTQEHENYVRDIISLEVKKVKEIEGLQSDILDLSINRQENEYKKAQMIRDRDIKESEKVSDYRANLLAERKLLENKFDEKSIKQREQLDQRINLIGDRMREQQMAANIEYNKKVAELNAKSEAERQRIKKETLENEKKLVKSQLETLIKENKFLVDATTKGSEERLKAELVRLNTVLLFEEQNSAKLELTYEDLQLKRQAVEKESQTLIEEFENNQYNKRIKNKEEYIKAIQSEKELELEQENLFGERSLAYLYQLIEKEKLAQEEKTKILLENEELSADQRLIIENESQKTKINLDKEYFQFWKENFDKRNQYLEKAYKMVDDRTEKELETTLTVDKRKYEITKAGLDQKLILIDQFKTMELDEEQKRIEALYQLQEGEGLNHNVFLNNKLMIEMAYGDKIFELRKQQAERDKALREKELEDSLKITENGIGAVQALTDFAFTVKMNKARGNAREEEKLAKEQFEINKAMQVGMAIIDGIRAVQTSLAFAPLVIGVAPNPAGIANLAFTLITSAANIAKILATQYQSKSFSAAGGGGSSIGAGGNVAAGPSQTFNPAQFYGLGGQAPVNVGVGGPNIVGPQKVFVVETDITSVQRNVRGIEQRAEIE